MESVYQPLSMAERSVTSDHAAHGYLHTFVFAFEVSLTANCTCAVVVCNVSGVIRFNYMLF